MLMLLPPDATLIAALSLTTVVSVVMLVTKARRQTHDPETEYRKLENRIRHPFTHWFRH